MNQSNILIKAVRKLGWGFFSNRVKISLFLILLLMILSVGSQVKAADKENCLMCHKYRQLGRIDEQGKKRSYYVDENGHSQVERIKGCPFFWART